MTVRILADGNEVLVLETTAVALDEADATAAGERVATARWFVFRRRALPGRWSDR